MPSNTPTLRPVQPGPSAGPSMGDLMRWGVVFAPEDGTGTPPAPEPEPIKDATPEPAPRKKAVSPPADPAPAPDPTESLKAQIDALKSQLANFGDATPDEIKQLRELRAQAEKERKEAEAAAREAERERLRKEGDFETLRQRMAEEHQRELEAARSKSGELDQTVSALTRQIENMALGTAFASSRFVQEETIIGPDKARRIYGAHFDVVDGKVIGYDAPRGEAKRVALVDARGEPLAFDEAIKRLVESDPDRDRLLKAQQKPGPGAMPSPGVRPAPPPEPEVRGQARLAKTLGPLLGRVT